MHGVLVVDKMFSQSDWMMNFVQVLCAFLAHDPKPHTLPTYFSCYLAPYIMLSSTFVSKIWFEKNEWNELEQERERGKQRIW